MKTSKLIALILTAITITINVDSFVLAEKCVGAFDNSNFKETEENKIYLLGETNEDKPYTVEGGNIYYDPSTGTITGCDNSVVSAVIPDTIDGNNITSIGDWAFSGCNILERIEISSSIISIGKSAFFNCGSLTNINVERENKFHKTVLGPPYAHCTTSTPNCTDRLMTGTHT